MKGGEMLFDLLYPPQCIGCGFWFAWGIDGWWCDSCDLVRSASGPFVRELDGITIYSAHHYTCAPVAAAVQTIKYNYVHAAARVCAAWLAPLIAQINNDNTKTVIIPVPLHSRREADRGFNQTSLIARELCVQTKSSYDDTLLYRRVYTQSQAQSDGETRSQQLRDAFHTMRTCDPSITYIILDDVITTGSTLQSCITTMRAAGATRIIGLTIATTA